MRGLRTAGLRLFGVAALAAVLLCGAQAAPPRTWNVAALGAVPDAAVLSTAAFQRAIDECSAAGGGVVLVPPGDWRVGTLYLKSGVELRLAEGATLWGSTREADYDGRRLIWAVGAERIAITGPGTIDGEGAAFEPDVSLDPHLIDIYDCRGVVLRDLTLRNSASWTVHLLRCERVRVERVRILDDLERPGTDGIDPDGSRDVLISRCFIRSGDDAVALKSTSRAGPGYPTENVVVEDSTLITYKTALKVGTETHGDIRDCLFRRIQVLGSSRGIGIWMLDGGTVERLRFRDIEMELREIPEEDKSGEPIRIVLERRREDSPLGTVRDISISDITVRSPWRSILWGHPDRPLEGVTIERLSVRQERPRVKPSPWYVFDCRHLRGLFLRDVTVAWEGEGEPTASSVLRASGVDDLLLLGLAAEGWPADAVLWLEDCSRTVVERGSAPR